MASSRNERGFGTYTLMESFRMSFSRTLTCALVALLTTSIVAPPAEACIFGLFRRRAQPVAASYPVVACPAPVVAAAVPACPQPVMAAAVPACPQPTMAAAVPAAPACGCDNTPIAVAKTCMQQRCYMAPVTTMECKTSYEAVTSYQTSHYVEPVTTMRASSYYDPCQCGYVTVNTPCTSYVQRSQVTPVTNWVARNYQVPVTKYEQRCVMEPVTQVQYYYPGAAPVQAAVPAQAVVPVPVAAAPAQYLAPAPMVAPAPLAVPAAPAQYLAPTPVQAMTAQPQLGMQPQQAQYQTANAPANGGQVQRNYPENGNTDPNRVEYIDRVYRNGQLEKEIRRYGRPGEAAPPASRPDGTNSSFVPTQPQLLDPVPRNRMADVSTTGKSIHHVSASNPYYK